MIGGTLGSGVFDFTVGTVCETRHARRPAWDGFAANWRTYGLDPEDDLTEVLTRLHHNATTVQGTAITRLAQELRAARNSA